MNIEDISSRSPLDIEKFKGITENNRSAEKEILEFFFLSVSESVDLLMLNRDEEKNKVWLAVAEELQALAKELGANLLETACINAARDWQKGASNKDVHIGKIKSEIEKLRVFLRNTRY